MPFDPDQPRDEQGQWTSGGAGSAIQNAASDKKKLDKFLPEKDSKKEFVMNLVNNRLKNEPVLKKVAAIEEQIRFQHPYESAAMFDENGNMVLFKDGQVGKVAFSDDEMDRAWNGVMTHNHPKDVSFSNGDIYFAMNAHLREIRAASMASTFVFRPNYTYASYDRQYNSQAMKEAWQSAWDDVTYDLKHQIEDGQITRQEANHQVQHLTMRKFADQTKSFYEKRDQPVPTGINKKLLVDLPDYETFKNVVQDKYVK